METLDSPKIPVPKGPNVYTFRSDIWSRFTKWQSSLTEKDELEIVAGKLPIWEEIKTQKSKAAELLQRVHFPVIQTKGRPILAIEPHCDDVALSIGGTLLKAQRPLHIVTVFGHSRNLHPKVRAMRDLQNKEISKVRHKENRLAFSLLSATHDVLPIWEAPWPLEKPDDEQVDSLVQLLLEIINEHPEAELVAPACVSHHPDHWVVRKAAEKLGCAWFWEDLDFYPNYARTVEDREFFAHEWDRGIEEYKEISDVAMLKLAMLSVYQSQYFPPTEMSDVLRYAWAVAQEGIRDEVLPVEAGFAERSFRKGNPQ